MKTNYQRCLMGQEIKSDKLDPIFYWMRSFLVLLVISALSINNSEAQALSIKKIDAAEAVDQISNALTEGRKETAEKLKKIDPSGNMGLKDEINYLQRLDDQTLYGLSSVTLIETLYRRAEATKSGEGNRLLAVIYMHAAKESAALAEDLSFDFLRNVPLDSLSKPFKFSQTASIENLDNHAPIPPSARKAIDKLSKVYAGRHISQFKNIALRRFKKAQFSEKVFDKIIAESTTGKEALRRVIHAGMPMPPIEIGLRDALLDAVGNSAAFGLDQEVLTLIEELSNKELPINLRRYTEEENNFESRKRQIAEAKKVDLVGTVLRADDKSVLAVMDESSILKDRSASAPAIILATENIQNSSENGAPLITPPLSSHRKSNSPARPYNEFQKAYDSYITRTFEQSPHIATPTLRSGATPRAYNVAIGSARAARGIAVGGNFRDSVNEEPVAAFWLPNRKDDRFGHIFIKFSEGGTPHSLLATSRILFSDSFYAALSVVSEKHGREATLRDGEILVLQSMDPDSQVGQKEQKEIRSEAEKLKKQLYKAKDNDDFADSFLKFISLSERMELLPRGIVIHPALVGRELAWATARVDFWFNQLELLKKESLLISGESKKNDNLFDLPISEAVTWQFYELNSTIKLSDVNERPRQIIVASESINGKAPPVQSHFGVSMFGEDGTEGDSPVEDGLYKLKALERDTQPLLDWLATNHHDFMRLNDFSESLSLLRWLRSKNVKFSVIDMDGEGNEIPTPDRVILGDGPRVGPK